VADLSDFMIEQYEKNGTVDDVRTMAAEIRRRRAEGLSDGDRADLILVRTMVAYSSAKPESIDDYMRIRHLLDRLIGGRDG
jgi:hypothetical protein